MKGRAKSKKQRDQERELLREEKKGEFETLYEERKKFFKEINWFRPNDSLQEFVNKELDKWEQQQLKIPTGKYRDEKKDVSIYQQKFVEYTRQLCPQIIEELREFVPYFDRLFGEQKDKYIDIFGRYKDEIFDLDSSLDNEINYFLIKEYFLRFRPNSYREWNYDYTWGKYRILFHFLYFLFLPGETTEKRNRTAHETIQLLQNNLVFERNGLNLPDDFDKLIIQNYISKQSSEIFLAILSGDKQECFRKQSKQRIINFLKDISPIPETNFADFIKLQFEVTEWVERHNLQKDWLLRYAYFFLFQFSNNPDVELSEIEIGFLNVRSLAAFPFEFQFNGWLAGDEEKEEYEKRLIKSFKSELQRYFHSVSNHFDLDEKKRITKPIVPDFESIKWLIAWNEGATQPEIADFFCKSKPAIDSGIDRLLGYNLPKREGKRGRKKQLFSRERLSKIKAIK
jgi:hypothetical protein